MRAILCALLLAPCIAHAQFSGGGITLAQAAAAAPVQSVATRIGDVVLSSTDIADWTPAVTASSPVQSVSGKTGAVALVPTDISGFVASASASAPVQSVAGRTGV